MPDLKKPPPFRKVKIQEPDRFEKKMESRPLHRHQVEFSLDSDSLPEGKDWDVNHDYQLGIKVEMIEKRARKGTKESFQFRIKEVKPIK